MTPFRGKEEVWRVLFCVSGSVVAGPRLRSGGPKSCSSIASPADGGTWPSVLVSVGG